MTLLDAPIYDPTKARRRRNVLIGLLIAVLVLGGFAWYFWDWPETHRVNEFFAAVESGNMAKAFGIWNNDADWEQHLSRYTAYPFGRFESDWGHNSDWGEIKTHKILMAKTVGSGVVVGVQINGEKTPAFLWVERKTKTIGFSPVQLTTD